MIIKDQEVSCPLSPDFDLSRVEEQIRALQMSHPTSFKAFAVAGQQMKLEPATFALLLETVKLRDVDGPEITPADVWEEAATKYSDVMRRAVRAGVSNGNNTSFLKGNWGTTLSGITTLLGPAWNAFVGAIAVQEFNAGMGLVSAAPTGGASGTVPGTLIAVCDALMVAPPQQIASLLVAGLVGRVAFGRGPVSGAQAGCGGEVGIASGMAAGGVAYLLGGNWEQIDAAAALASTPFVGTECSPTLGLVEYPCVPRNGFAALCAIGAAHAACAGIVPPYGLDETFDRIFAVGGLLPESLRETNNGHWAAPACRNNGCNNCGSK